MPRSATVACSLRPSTTTTAAPTWLHPHPLQPPGPPASPAQQQQGPRCSAAGPLALPPGSQHHQPAGPHPRPQLQQTAARTDRHCCRPLLHPLQLAAAACRCLHRPWWQSQQQRLHRRRSCACLCPCCCCCSGCRACQTGLPAAACSQVQCAQHSNSMQPVRAAAGSCSLAYATPASGAGCHISVSVPPKPSLQA